MSERVRVLTRDDGQLVARKVVTDAARLAHEERMLQAAQHPGVVQLAEAATSAGSGGAVGGELDTVWAGSHSLETHAALTTAQAAGTIAALATTVADLHQAGITHHRISASHALIGRDGRPVLCGFGDAERASSVVDATHQAGMADDVAALGRLLRALIDHQPARRHGLHDKGRAQRRDLLALADRACHDEPSRRPSARALAAALIDVVPAADLPTVHRDTAEQVGTADDRPFIDVDPSAASADRHVANGEVADVSPAASPSESPEVGSPPTDPADPADPFDRLRRTATEPAPRRPVLGRHRLGALLAVLLAFAAIALAPQAWSSRSSREAASSATSLRVEEPTQGPSPDRSDAAAGPSTADTSSPSTPSPDDHPAGTSSTAQPGAGRCPETQLATAHLAADIDGDLCPDPVLVDGNTITVGDRRWEIGRAGDAIAIADWDCDGTATPALLRRPTGEIFVFDAWARPGEEVSVETLSTISDAALITPTPGVSCPDVIVTRRDGGTVSIPASEK